MLKGLLTRQIFMFVDLLLAVLTVFVAYQVFTKLFQPPVSAVAPTTDATEAAVPTLPTVGPRDSYQIIVASSLFGDAGNVAKPPVIQPGPDDGGQVEVTKLKLKLKGTSFTKIRPNALIEREGVGAKVYEAGEEVIEGQARLDEVHNRWVYLFNTAENKREILRMDEDDKVASAETPKGPALTPPTKGPGGAASFKKDEIAQELMSATENLADLMTTTAPRPVEENGKVIGYTADNIGSLPLAQKMGFKDGDILSDINGMPIDSIESIQNAIAKYGEASDFRITIMRGGKKQLLKFKLE